MKNLVNENAKIKENCYYYMENAGNWDKRKVIVPFWLTPRPLRIHPVITGDFPEIEI